jgi:hypothetical protein
MLLFPEIRAPENVHQEHPYVQQVVLFRKRLMKRHVILYIH